MPADLRNQTPTNRAYAKQKTSNPSQLSGSVNSLSSGEQAGTLPSAPDTPHRQSLTGHLSELDRGAGKDIGGWMRQQQQYVAEHYQQGFYCYPSMGQDSLTNAGLSEYSHDESMSMAPCFMHPAVQIQDAQVCLFHTHAHIVSICVCVCVCVCVYVYVCYFFEPIF